MAHGTRSKASIVDKSAIDKELDDTQSIYNDLTSHRSSRTDSPYTSVRGLESDSENRKIMAFQSGLKVPNPNPGMISPLKMHKAFYLRRF